MNNYGPKHYDMVIYKIIAVASVIAVGNSYLSRGLPGHIYCLINLLYSTIMYFNDNEGQIK